MPWRFRFPSLCSPVQPFRIFNTWLGDHTKNLFLNEVIKVIRTENLLEEVQRSGRVMLQGLYDLQVSRTSVCVCDVSSLVRKV